MTGDGSITARVTALEATNFYARAGVMIRQSTATNSKFADIMLHTSDGGVRLQSRTTTGGNTSEINGAIVNPVYWVRMERNGSTFTGSISPDGVTWSVVGTRTISMTSTVLVGLALTPRDDSFLNTVKFDNVSTTPTGPVSAGGEGAGAGSKIAAGLLLSARTSDGASHPSGQELDPLGGFSGSGALGNRILNVPGSAYAAQDGFPGHVREANRLVDRPT